ncbi:protein-methionine sulfoxide oxidase MICAL-like protein [Sarcoptes scabiei]|uniref:Protein-methionine sulfoxide oxidase MICAL-like protein n=1 Tax=Sarcoptes scabiei TaxID=52283 RepID=A0A132ADB2_SARSC|nr:protein-methionine sulfoxide oxidase MICAL-like protein [Sarcoptes scabiei]
MYTFEAKRFYGQFCVGSIDHVSIRQLQLILLKISLIYGLKFYPNINFIEICPKIIEPQGFKCNPVSCECCCHMHGFGGGAYAHFGSQLSDSSAKNELNRQSFDVIIGCDGRRNTFSRYFPRNNRRGKLAIGLTANFINRRTEEEAHCPEISGISKIYNQKWFKDLQDETAIELENLVYYRDETHYFVMTATKASLLKRGVLKHDSSDSHQLLHLDNSKATIDTSKLMRYSKDAAEWSSKLRRLEFARNSNNMPDVALFDFTSMYSATNASCAKKIYLQCCSHQSSLPESADTKHKYMLLLLCGDSLLEPFWPTGSGAGRGFLSALDAAWTVSQWFATVPDETKSLDAMLDVICRREYVYRLLAQTSPENTTSKNFTLDPQSRYKNLNILNHKTMQDMRIQSRHLIIDKIDIEARSIPSYNETKRARRATVGIDPQDIYKAKNLVMTKSDLDECNRISFGAFKRYYPVPTPTNPLSKSFSCDRKPVEVIELRPKNFDGNINRSNKFNRHLDARPRNQSNKDTSTELIKKNHHARNHFLFDSDQSFEFNDTLDQSRQQSIERTLTNNTIDSILNSSTFSSPIDSDNNGRSSQSSNYLQIITKTSSNACINKENSPYSSKAHGMNLRNRTFESSLNDYDQYDSRYRSHSNHPPQQQSLLSSSFSLINSGNDEINNINDSIADRANHLFQSDSNRNYLSLHDFQKSLNRKPKKSSDILEKANFLAQKFEEHKKPYVPSLSKVGKIEENDWNVKVWNSSDIFGN